ncbi:MAG: hypothetical protein WD423_07025 [Rhodothermales bacterium]
MKAFLQRYAWLNGILGIWVAATPFFGFDHVVVLASNLVVGAFALLSGFAINTIKPWQGWTLALLGFFLYLTAFFFELHIGSNLWWNNITVGGLIAIAGFAARQGTSARAS